jgi:glycosyltransferase involved in cell wall biosynthesis
MPSILMFAPVCYPPANPEGIVTSKLVLAMLKAGWHVDVITSNRWARYPAGAERLPPGLEGRIHTVRLPRKWSAGCVAACLRSKVSSRVPYPPWGDPWSVPALRQARVLLARHNYDFILSRALPIVGHTAALLLHRETDIPWIANWNDPTPFCMAPAPYGGGPVLGWASKSLPARVFARGIREYLKSVARQAAWHTFPCERLRQYICSYLPVDVQARSSVIPHVALSSLRMPVEPCKSFTLCHSGSLLPPRSPDTLFAGIRLFLDETRPAEGIRVRFFGADLEHIRPRAAALGIAPLVSVEKGVPYEESLRALAQETVLVIIEPDMADGIFLPSKLVDYVQTGRPILALSPRCGTINDLLRENAGGISVDGGSPREVARALAVLYRAWKAGTLETDFGSHRLWPYFCEDAVIDTYRSLLGRLKDAGRLSMGGSTGERG